MTGNSFDERVAARYDETIGSWGDPTRHGLFVVEIMLPELQRLPRSETFLPFAVGAQHLGFDEYDVV